MHQQPLAPLSTYANQGFSTCVLAKEKVVTDANLCVFAAVTNPHPEMHEIF